MEIPDDSGQRATAPIDVDPCRRAAVLAPEHRRAGDDADAGDGAECDLLAGGGQDGKIDEVVQAATQLAGIANADRVACEPLDRLPDRRATDRAGHDLLHIGDVEAVARSSGAIDHDVDIAPAGQPLGERRTHARNGLGHGFDFLGDGVDLREARARYLDADRAFDARCQHVDTIADRRDPEIGEAGHPHAGVELVDQLLLGHTGPPLVPGLEPDRGLEHFERRGVGRGIGAAGLAEHAFDLGHGLDEPVGLLEQHPRFGGRNSGQRRGHVQQIAFVHRWHELAAGLADRPKARCKHKARDKQGLLGPGEHPVEGRPVSLG